MNLEKKGARLRNFCQQSKKSHVCRQKKKKENTTTKKKQKKETKEI